MEAAAFFRMSKRLIATCHGPIIAQVRAILDYRTSVQSDSMSMQRKWARARRIAHGPAIPATAACDLTSDAFQSCLLESLAKWPAHGSPRAVVLIWAGGRPYTKPTRATSGAPFIPGLIA